MNDTPEDHQPDVLEACWDREQIEALFSDLEVGADVTHVQVRTTTGPLRSDDTAVTLQEARQLLQEGRAQAIQIYYGYDGQSWCDTLMVLPDTVRIIRTVIARNQ